MCGITGALWIDPQDEVTPELLQEMTHALTHRGPDDFGTYHQRVQTHGVYGTTPGIALGHRRLSIIDVNGGHQPLSNEDQTVWTAFNGEIYNFRSLRSRLEGSGHRFATSCDTEVIVHLYEDEGADCFNHFNGMFAIAIWDQQHRKLILARDRIGQKPLYYCQQGGRFIFASELKAILKVPGISKEINPNAIDAYLTYQYVPHPNSIFQGIKKLSPGCLLEFDGKQLSVQSYWNPLLDREVRVSKDDAAGKLRTLFDDSVRLRMQSDVPLGAFLSGGIDSSLVVASMQKQSEAKVKTFSIGFPQKEYDETQYAQEVADYLGTEHQQFQVTPDAVSILPRLIEHYDEPFADSSAIPTWYVSELTRQHVTVALSGDGGDELFAGYQRYYAVNLASLLDRLGPLSKAGSGLLMRCLPAGGKQKSLLRKARRFAEAIGSSPPRRYLDWISIFNETRRADLYREEFLAKLSMDPFQFLNQAWKRVGSRDAISCASLADLTTYLPCDLNTKVDIASMAHGLECRQPFLDYRLVEFAASLPVGLKWRSGRGKRLLQDAFSSDIPRSIWKRKKMGFGVPLDYWFRDELRELLHDTLTSDRCRSRGYFRIESVDQLLAEHDQSLFDHSARLWALLVLELWHQTWMD